MADLIDRLSGVIERKDNNEMSHLLVHIHYLLTCKEEMVVTVEEEEEEQHPPSEDDEMPPLEG